uniref:Secreted protein n=1 Tax=Anguilla anguilla TaxID=7936 RepID=A0A0E9VIB1_ANGAN
MCICMCVCMCVCLSVCVCVCVCVLGEGGSCVQELILFFCMDDNHKSHFRYENILVDFQCIHSGKIQKNGSFTITSLRSKEMTFSHLKENCTRWSIHML